MASLVQSLLLRLALRVHLFAIRRAYKTCTQLNYIVRYRFRILEENREIEGHDPHYDEINLVASARLLTPTLFGNTLNDAADDTQLDHVDKELVRRYQPIQSDVEGLIDEYGDDPIIQDAYNDYWRVQQYIKRLSSHTTDADNLPPRELPVDDLDTAGLLDLERSVRRRLKSMREIVSDRSALKLDLSQLNLTPIASMFFALFVVSGYFYQSLLLSNFGLSVGHYFSLYSYLSSSLDSIYNASLSAAIALIAAFFYLDAQARAPHTRGGGMSSFDWVRGLAYIGLFASLYVFREHKTVFLFHLEALGILASAHISGRIAIKHFRQPLHAMFILSFLGMFFVGMYIDVAKTVHEFRHDSWPSLPVHSIHYEVGTSSDLPTEAAILSASDSHIFLVDSDRQSYAIPKSLITAVIRDH